MVRYTSFDENQQLIGSFPTEEEAMKACRDGYVVRPDGEMVGNVLVMPPKYVHMEAEDVPGLFFRDIPYQDEEGNWKTEDIKSEIE